MSLTRRSFLAGASAALAAPAFIGRAQAADAIKFVSILDQSGGSTSTASRWSTRTRSTRGT